MNESCRRHKWVTSHNATGSKRKRPNTLVANFGGEGGDGGKRLLEETSDAKEVVGEDEEEEEGEKGREAGMSGKVITWQCRVVRSWVRRHQRMVFGNILPHTATHCHTLPHTATYCNTLQHTATH